MINEQELLLSNNSPIKKDFYQIYPEILDIVTKITDRWDPTTSNESDPGVVLLKLLAFIGDKVNYNIDKNVLECFMPSATQEDSMRKLCDMMGYDMSYYQSAITPVSFAYMGDKLDGNNYIKIKPFTTVITNEDETLTYVVIGKEDPDTGLPDGKESRIQHRGEAIEALAIEGEYCTCYAGESELIQIYNLDDNRRFYLPEATVAENGIFIRAENAEYSEYWKRVTNLNTQQSGQAVYKFGYDSKKYLPYIQFPEDVALLIGDGLHINYIRTRGLGGNVKAYALSKLSSSLYLCTDSSTEEEVLDDAENNISITNFSAATNGKDVESLDEAYNNFKKTVGTFDTLVTCRDYANKIYQLINSDGNPYVSNVQVGDIRDDLNKSYSIATFNSYGTSFVNKSKVLIDSGTQKEYNAIEPYDLYLYLFKPITGAYTKDSYNESFSLYEVFKSEIERDLADYKTIAHNFKSFTDSSELAAIKNYVTISAKITTTRKVNSSEEKNILGHIKEALYKAFNMRKVDWGEPLTMESIRQTIAEADPLIKNVDLDEPDLETRFLGINGKEYSALDNETQTTFNSNFVTLVMKNALAGRVPLFDYFDTFEYDFGEMGISLSNTLAGKDIAKLVTKFEPALTADSGGSKLSQALTLKEGETIQFSAPSYNATLTYPAYINYYWEGATVSKGTNHLLGANEKLYINYTDTNENVWNLIYYNDGDAGYVIKNRIVTEQLDHPVIICPEGFDLIDSNTRHATTLSSGHTAYEWAKTAGAGYDFGTNNPTGMYSLGASETIALKTPVEIKLDKTLYCDWVVNDPNNLIYNRFSPITIGTDSYYAFTLDTGEYFFYTSSSKTDLGILGSGTRLMIKDATESTIKQLFGDSYSETKPDSQEIASLGLNASFNWKSISFSTNACLILQEREYITLTEDDILSSLVLEDTTATKLSSSSVKVKKAEYQLAGSAPTLLPTLPGDNKWEVISRLDLNVGPKAYQQLLSDKDSIEFYSYEMPSGSSEGQYVLKGTLVGSNDESIPVCLKSSSLIQRSGGVFLLNPDHSEGKDVQFKIFSKSAALKFNKNNAQVLNPTSGGIKLNVKTFENLYTKVSCSDDDVQLIKLPTWIPAGYFGLMMVYYYPVDPQARLIVWSSPADNISLYNYIDGDTAQGAVENLKYTYTYTENNNTNTIITPQKGLVLKRGISIIKLSSNCQYLYIDNRNGWTDSSDVAIKNYDRSVITFGVPSLVSTTNNSEGINTELLGITSGEISSLLSQIRKAATTEESYPVEGSSVPEVITQNIFYYNSPVDGSVHIDINTKAGESLKSPSSWYDYNNIANKFVISELDADKFDTHIQLTKSSKL